MPYPINQRAHQFNSIQSVPVSFGLWDTALKFLSPGPRSDVTDHLEKPTRLCHTSSESLFTLQHSAQWRDATLTPQPIRCQLQLPSMTSDVVLSLRQAHEKLREEIRTALSVLLRENSTVAITIFCIFCFEAVARGLVCLDDVSNNRLKIHIPRPTP